MTPGRRKSKGESPQGDGGVASAYPVDEAPGHKTSIPVKGDEKTEADLTEESPADES